MTAEAVSVGPSFFHEAMPIENFRRSPLNPRQHFDPVGLEGLATSIRENGIIEPIVARPVEDYYEIVVGERRWRASTMAGLTTIPCTVRHLSDAQALEIMVIENNQREDVNALEEADGFSRLLTAGYTAPRLAERIGRSTKYVYDRVKLLELVPEAQTLVLDGRITAGHAILLARLTPEDQARAIDPQKPGLFEFDNFGIADRATLTETKDPYENAHPLSVREFKGWIDEHVRLDLDAPVDAELFPEVAVAQEEAARVVSITLDAYVNPVDEAAGVLACDDWQRIDEGTVPCARSVLGVVVIGFQRGRTFPVCIDRACDIHWPPEQARASRRSDPARPTETESGTPIGSATAEDRAWEQKRARERAEIAQYQQLTPKLRAAFLARVKALKEPALVAFVVRHDNVDYFDGLPKSKTAVDVLRQLVWMRVGGEIERPWNAPVQIPKLAKALGVDLKPLLKPDAKAVQTSAPKPAARSPHRSLPKPSAKKKAKER